MIEHITSQLEAAGCTVVFYENDQMANVAIDVSLSADTIGVIIEPSTVAMEITGNGVNERYPAYVIEILKQIQPERSAVENRTNLESTMTVTRDFLYRMIRSGLYKKIPNVQLIKINERKYDANVIGWQMAIQLQLITNRDNCVTDELFSCLDIIPHIQHVTQQIIDSINAKFTYYV